MKRSRRMLASIPLAGSFLITSMVANVGDHYPARAAESGENRNSTIPSTPPQQSAGNIGDTGVRLHRFEDGSVGIEGRREINSRLRNNDLFFPSNIRVVKIGDTFTKGQSLEQLTQLLQGPRGSSVPVTLFSTGHVTVKPLRLFSADELRGKRELINAMSLVQNNDIYTNWRGSNRDLCATGNNNRQQGNILTATSAYISGTEELPFHFTAFYDDNLQGLGDALDFYARTGMFARFDMGVKNVLDASAKNVEQYTDLRCAALIKCASTLIKYGYTTEGQQILQRLYKSPQKFSPENKVKTLLELARLAQLQSDNSAALNAFKELTDTCLSNAAINPEVQNSALVEVVAYAISQKDSDLAVKAQLRVNECAGSSPGFRILPTAQEELRLKVSLADAYDLTDHRKAVETLLKALTEYEGKSTRDDTTLADRIFTICPASVRFKLAYMSLRDGHQDDAKKYFEAGANLWSEDLGSSSPSLDEIKNTEHAFAKELTDKNKVELLSSLGKLPGVTAQTMAPPSALFAASTENDNDKHSYTQSREVYDAAVSGKSDLAIQRLNSLIKQESTNPHHNALDVAKLVNVVSASSKAIGKIKVEEYLNQLETLFSESNSLIEPAALYVRSEEILLHDPKEETAQWEKFDNYLTDIAEASGFSPSTLDDPKSRIPRLIEVSYSYAIRKEFARAVKFVQYIKLKYPEAAENMSNVILYQMTLQCLLGNKAEAENSLDAVLSARSKRGSDSKLIETAAAAFANTGNRTASLRLLKSTDDSTRDIHTNRQLAFYRALVYYKFGNYREALAELSDSQDVMLSGQSINELRRLRAELLVRNGQLDNGIQALCETSGDETIERLAFERALELLKTEKNIPELLVEKLLDYASRTQHGGRVAAQDGQLDRALRELLAIAQEHQCPAAKIFGLQQRLGITTTSGAAQSAAANSKTATVATTVPNVAAPTTTNAAPPVPPIFTPNAEPSGVLNASSTSSSKFATATGAQTSYSVAYAARQLIAAQKYQEGCATFVRALQMDDGANFNNNMYHYGNLKGDLSVQVLLDAKQFEVLETILNQALKTRLVEDSKLGQNQKTYGLVEKTLLCELYLAQDKYDEAKRCANETVKAFKENNKWCSIRRNAQESSSHALNISIVRQFITKKQFTTARALLDQLDGILNGKVGPKHVLWIEDKLTRAQLLEAEGKLEEAEKLAKEVLDLETWMNGTRPAASRNTYASILREEGKTAAADAVEAVPDTDFKYDSKEVYGNTGMMDHSPSPVIFADTAEDPLKKFLDNHVIQHGEGSAETQKAMDDLARFYVQKQRWNNAEKVQIRELKILDQIFGPCLEPKQSCFLNLAEIYKGKNDKRLASKYTELIKLPTESKFADGSETVDKLRLANVLFFLGKKDEAVEMAKSVETTLLQKNMNRWQVNQFILFDDLIAFMKSADASSDAIALEAEKIKRYGPRAANRTLAAHANPSREQRQKDNLEKAQKGLSDAEANKEKDPTQYFHALLGMFIASINRSAIRSTEPEDGEKYFLSAVECFQQYAPRSTRPESIPYDLGNLWSETRFLSDKTFSSVFDRLCQCSKWMDDSGYRQADNEMLRALQGREPNMRGTEKKKYLQRAIDIRKVDAGPKSKRLGTLYTHMAICCDQLGDTIGAEQNRLDSVNLDNDAYEQVYRWLDLARFYGRIHKTDKEEVTWRKAMEVANKNTLTSDARSWIPFIKELQNEGHTKAADEVISFLLVRPDPNTLNDLDKYLSERIDAYVASLDFERATWLIKKRLTLATSGALKTSYVTDWQVRLSNVYLAQGKERESQELFNSIVASLALQGLSADELKRDRAVLLKRLGKTAESVKLNATVPSTAGSVIISSPMMAKELIRFGHNSLISSFNSSEQNMPGVRQQFSAPGMRGDPTTIICQGMVTHDSGNLLFGGKIACRQSDFGKASRWDFVSVPTGATMNDAIRVPQSATPYVPTSSEEGDYTSTDLVEPRQPRRPNSSSTYRLFLQDGPGKNEFEGPRGGDRQNSYQQVQVWYNGTKPIKIHDFAGLLYAPHAVVQIEFNGHFRGALVARQILLEGNNNIELDRGIVGKNFGQ